jgi:O-antigen/teichoic acid export membrane protein
MSTPLGGAHPTRPGEVRSVASDSVETLLLRGLLYGAGFVGSVLVSRGLGPEGRGAYYLPVVAAGTITAACTLGLEHTNVYLRGRGVSVERLAGQSGLVALVMGAVGVLVLLLGPWAFPALFADIPGRLLVLAALTIPFALHTLYLAGLLTLDGRVTLQFRIGMAVALVQVTVLLALYPTPWFVVVTVLSVNLAMGLLTWYLTARALLAGRPRWILWEWSLLLQTLAQSLLLHVGMVLFFLHLRLDMFMVKTMLGMSALGEYSLAVVLAETVFMVTDPLALALLPRQTVNSVNEAAVLALRGVRINCLLGMLLGLGWMVAGLFVIRVFFGTPFATAYRPLVGLLPGIVFLAMQRPSGAPLIRAARPGRIVAIYAVSLGCNALLNVAWIPAWGTLGAALASTVSYGLGASLFLGWTARLAGVPLPAAVVPRAVEVATLRRGVGVACRLLREALPVPLAR